MDMETTDKKLKPCHIVALLRFVEENYLEIIKGFKHQLNYIIQGYVGGAR